MRSTDPDSSAPVSSGDESCAPRLIPRPSLVLEEGALREAVQALLSAQFFVVDVETDGLDFLTNSVVWVGLSAPGQRYLVPLSHPNGSVISPARVVEEPDMSTVRPWKNNPTKFTKPKLVKVSYPAVFSEPPEQIRPDIAFDLLEPLFFSDVPKVGHNLKFDLKSMAKYFGGRIPSGPYRDTLILQHVLDENRTTYGLKDISSEWFLGLAAQNQVVRNKFYPQMAKGGIMDKSIDDIASYLSRDITYTQWLYERFRSHLTPALHRVFNFEMQFYDVIMRMEYDGIRTDPNQIDVLSAHLDEEIKKVETDIFRIVGSRIVLSNADVRKHYLFAPKDKGGQGLKPLGTTKTGKPQLRKEDLVKLAEENELASLYLTWTGLSKMKSSFIEPYKTSFIHPKTGRTHATFKQHGTTTGRLSSSDPNLQQIPARSDLGKQFRRCFVPEEGSVFIVADYDQIELRCIAYQSKDPEMIRLFSSGEDIHRTAAAAMYQVDPEDVTEEQRAAGKTFNFAIGYGASARRLSQSLGIPIKDGEVFISRYYERFSRLLRWKEEIIRQAVERGDRHDPVHFPPYVEIPPLGRRRRLPGLFSADPYDGFRAQRQAVNAVVQGFATYIMKIGTVQLRRQLDVMGGSGKIVSQIHDEIVVECDRNYADEIYAAVISSMQGVFVDGEPVLGQVPLLASGGIGGNWVEAKK